MEDHNHPYGYTRDDGMDSGAANIDADQSLNGNNLSQAPFDPSVGPIDLSTVPVIPPWERGSTVPDQSSIEEDGRQYQAYRDGKYLLPNDGSEQDRLDFQHYQWFLLLDGALALAPIHQPASVLDIGTGTGIWALEFAEANPGSKVIGTDLSAIQPSRILPNCSFIQEDVEDEWTIQGKFDYIHLRMVFTCFSSPRSVIQTLFEKVKPGGWVEYQDVAMHPGDIDGSLQTISPSIRRWAYLNMAGAATLGRDWNCTAKYKEWMIEAGFVDVYEHIIKCPGNGWPTDPKQKLIGQYCSANFLQGVEGICLKCMKGGLGYSTEEVKKTVMDVKRDIVDTRLHYHWPYHIVYGRKPYSQETEPQLPLPSTLLGNMRSEPTH